MNREEAIKHLETYSTTNGSGQTTQAQHEEAKQMAIKALEQEPCDNAVSRQDVLDLAKKRVLVSNGNYESVCKAINELPSVNPIEPCGDAIDRAEAIKIASGYCHPANVAKELAKLPPVNPTKTGQWIPVSERLPEDKTYVLTTIKIPNRIAHARSGWYEGRFFHNDNGDVWKATDMEIIAWMPLPKPYEPQERSE